MARPGDHHRIVVGGARRVAVLLAGVVRPVHRRPGAGEAARLALPAALDRRHDHQPSCARLPGPPAAAGARQGDLHPVHRPGTRRRRVRPGHRRLRREGGEPGARVRRDAVPGPHRPPRLPGARIRPPRRAGGDHPGHRGHRTGEPQGAAGRPPRGRVAVAGPAARHPRPDRRGHRRGQGVGDLVADPGHAARPASRPRPGAGGRPEGDGTGLRPPIFDSCGRYAAAPEAIAAMLEDAVTGMQARAARLAGKQRDHTPTTGTRSWWCWWTRWRS